MRSTRTLNVHAGELRAALATARSFALDQGTDGIVAESHEHGCEPIVRSDSTGQTFLTLRNWILEIDDAEGVAPLLERQHHLPSLIDVFEAEFLYAPSYDLIWVEKVEEDDRYWVFALHGATRSARRARMVGRVVTLEKVSWLLLQQIRHGPQQYARDARRFLTDSSGIALPSDFPIICGQPVANPKSKDLLIRLGQNVTWPLALPFDHWVTYAKPDDGFSTYRSVDWIQSGRTVRETLRDRGELDRRLEDRGQFLADSAFIVNHNYYPPWKNLLRPKIDSAVGLIRDVAEYIQIAQGGGCLRDTPPNLFFNPSADQADAILRNPRYRIIFANFHTHRGEWQACPTEDCREPLSLEPYVPNKSLQHVALFSAAHCQSVANPSNAQTVRSISERLLDAGVRRTSGSMAQESALDYFARLLFLFSDARALGPELFHGCLLAGTDFSELLGRVNEFLTSLSFPAIDTNATIN